MEPSSVAVPVAEAEALPAGFGVFLSQVFRKFAEGVAVSSVISFGLFYSGYAAALLASPVGNMLFVGGMVLQFVLVMWLAWLARRMSASQAQVLFFAYSAITGVTLSLIFITYQLSSILTVFATTTILFYIVSEWGRRTTKDLTGLGTVALLGLVGLIITSVINVFLQNTMTDLILAYFGVGIFVALIAYDAQKMKAFFLAGTEAEKAGTPIMRQLVILGALEFYLDFLNLFLSLLRILGRRN